MELIYTRLMSSITKLIQFLSFQSYLGSSMPSRELPENNESVTLKISNDDTVTILIARDEAPTKDSDTTTKKDFKSLFESSSVQ